MWGFNQYQPTQNVQQRQFRGTWVMANSYQEAQSMAVPMDGSPILVMLNDEQKFYLVSMQNGQRMISAFSFNALTIPTEPLIQESQPTNLEKRLAKLEELIGGLADEPDNKHGVPTRQK